MFLHTFESEFNVVLRLYDKLKTYGSLRPQATLCVYFTNVSGECVSCLRQKVSLNVINHLNVNIVIHFVPINTNELDRMRFKNRIF